VIVLSLSFESAPLLMTFSELGLDRESNAAQAVTVTVPHNSVLKFSLD
jgi:hypothetical protein